jgi:hypothetical protein
MVILLPEKSHRGCEKSAGRSRVLLDGSILAADHKCRRRSSNALDHWLERGIVRDGTGVKY